MRAFVMVLAALALCGCMSTLDGAYDEHAREECDRETRGSARSDCYDRIDENRRRRD